MLKPSRWQMLKRNLRPRQKPLPRRPQVTVPNLCRRLPTPPKVPKRLKALPLLPLGPQLPRLKNLKRSGGRDVTSVARDTTVSTVIADDRTAGRTKIGGRALPPLQARLRVA
jgi:hypothetical protein